MGKTFRMEIWEWTKAIALAAILAFLFRMFLFELFIVEGSSMYPTLEDGERVFVNKTAYKFNSPHQGDVIVFKYPFDQKRDFIKRIIALPGDSIEVDNGIVYVNEEPLTESYVGAKTEGYYPLTHVPEGAVFVLGDNRNHSMDSRDGKVGFVEFGLIKGKAVFVVWPLSKWRTFP